MKSNISISPGNPHVDRKVSKSRGHDCRVWDERAGIPGVGDWGRHIETTGRSRQMKCVNYKSAFKLQMEVSYWVSI